VDEAGRSTEPPVIADGSDGKGAGSASGVPPLPADEVGKPKPGSPYALGYRSGLASSSATGSDPAKGGSLMENNSADSDSAASGSGDGGSGGASGDGGSADGYRIANGGGSMRGNRSGSADGEGTGVSAVGEISGAGDLIGGAASALGEKLEGGRQAMRQAAAATTSWFANRAGTQTVARPLPDPSAPPETRPQPRTETMTQPETRPQPQAAYQPPAPQPQPSQPPSAARAPGYTSAATPAWQARAAGPERRSDQGRRGRRQAHLTLARVEPWSVMKFSFVASVVAFIILFVAITVLYLALSSLGVFTSLQHTVSTITSSQSTTGTNISGWFSASRILGYTGMLGALNIVLITALSTIGAVVYNLIAHVFGGVEVTLRESDLPAAVGVSPGASDVRAVAGMR
jgi:Transmembrane domain of unknown function (DUF3566)